MTTGSGICSPSKWSPSHYLKYFSIETASGFGSLIFYKNLLSSLLNESNEKGPVVFSSHEENSFYIEWISLVDLIFKEGGIVMENPRMPFIIQCLLASNVIDRLCDLLRFLQIGLW